jgi:hypothetical protein
VRSTLDELTREMGELRSLVESITPVNSALEGHHDSAVRLYLSIRRRFDYTAFIVALYASLEKFLENLVRAYARLAAQRTQYAALPAKLVQKHMAKSAEMLSRGRLGEGRYIGVRAVDLVKNLHDCLSATTPYALNDMAVAAHDANLRHTEIDALFSVVGIEHICNLVRLVDAMLDWYTTAHVLDARPQEGVPTVTIEQRIDDVVERRNQVAHRGGNPLDLLGPIEMSDAISFIEAFSTSVFSVLVARYLHESYIAPGRALALQVLEGPYQNGHVVVVARSIQRLYIGQPVFVVVSSGARWGRIVSLQINNLPVETVDQESTATSVGIEVDFRCPNNSPIYALEIDDDLVWSKRAATE